jgi:hypothetical protein
MNKLIIAALFLLSSNAYSDGLDDKSFYDEPKDDYHVITPCRGQIKRNCVELPNRIEYIPNGNVNWRDLKPHHKKPPVPVPEPSMLLMMLLGIPVWRMLKK